MFKRIVILGALLVAMLFGSASNAAAWTNGGRDPNNYGTHDWILDHGRRIAGAEGRWLNRSVALRASDDPDTYNWPNTFHLFYESGIRRGAAQRVADYYYLAVQAYRSGDTTSASKYVGILSHYYTDILQPFHSSRDARDMQTLHLEYEYDFGRYVRSSSALRSWMTTRTPQPVTDVRREVIDAAAYSRAYFPSLYRSFKTTHNISGATTTITRLMVNRGANDLADIIRTIPTGGGIPPATATMNVWMQHPLLAQNGTAGAFARCLDASGTPIEGAAVAIAWPLVGGGSTKVVVYTDANGVAHDYEPIGYAPFLRPMVVAVSQYSAGVTVRGTTSYMTTPPLATTGGISVKMSDSYPERRLPVTAYATLRGVDGRAVAGMPVTFKWSRDGYAGPYFKTETVATSQYGVAISPWNTGDLPVGTEVFVRVETVAAGHTRAAVTRLRVTE